MEQQLDNLTNYGMIDLMHSQFVRFKSVQTYINDNALWQRWIRR